MFDQLDRPVTKKEFRPNEIARPQSLDRQAILNHVLAISPGLDPADKAVSGIRGGRAQANCHLDRLDPEKYGSTRNHLEGAVTRLSPYIRHGVVSPREVRDAALDRAAPNKAEKFIQQLAWREYWHRLHREFPDHIWQDVEAYKTGFSSSDYADELPDDIVEGRTGVACIDQFILELVETGYLHNHARLYLAGYVCHWRRVKWQAGARWFLMHLLDGDLASNNLSWQWAASTFSHKPYYFNLENVAKFSGNNIDTHPEKNAALDGSYESLYARLFPNLEPKS